MQVREWTLADGKRIHGRAMRVTFGRGWKDTEIEIVEVDGTLWPLFVEDFATPDMKWIVSHFGERPPAAGPSVPFPE